MKNAKATFVTLLIALMLLVIIICLAKLWTPGFEIITGLLALYGLSRGALDFRRWLVKERKTRDDSVPPVFGEPAPKVNPFTVEPKEETPDEKPEEQPAEPEHSVDSILDEYHADVYSAAPADA